MDSVEYSFYVYVSLYLVGSVLLQSMANCCWQSSKYAIILLFIGML